MSMPRTLLVQFLRENLRLTGTHVGCDTSQCGACVVHVDGKAVKSCTTLAWQAEGANVTHHRRARRAERPAASDAGGVPRESRPAVRLLHARHDHDGGRHGEPQGQRARRQDHPPRARRQHLPLHRLPQHRQGDRGRRARRWRKAAGDEAAAKAIRSTSRGGDRHERDRDRRGGAPQGRPPLHHRQGPVHRRHQPSGPDPRHVRALAACPRQDQEHRQRKAAAAMPGVRRGADRRRACRRQDRQSDLRLDDPLQGRLADEDGAASGARGGQGLLRRRSRSRW